MKVDLGTKFVVLAMQRSGSTWLTSILNQLENATAYGELFLDRHRAPGEERKWDSDFAYPRFVDTKPDGLAVRPFSVFSYLDVLYRHPGAVGFKLMYSQLKSYPELLAYFVRHRTRVVHLVRRNHLDVVISSAIKAKLGQAHVLRDQPKPEAIRVELDTKTLMDRLKDLRGNIVIVRKLLRWCRLPHLEVAYEDLLRDRSRFTLIWGFLSMDLEGRIPSSNLVKIRTKGHADVISNYDEVKQALAGTAFAPLLE